MYSTANYKNLQTMIAKEHRYKGYKYALIYNNLFEYRLWKDNEGRVYNKFVGKYEVSKIDVDNIWEIVSKIDTKYVNIYGRIMIYAQEKMNFIEYIGSDTIEINEKKIEEALTVTELDL